MQRKKQSLERVRLLQKHFRDGKIPRLTQHEVHPNLGRGSRENYLYFTLPVSINFQRNSPAMWRSALKTWEDDQTRSVFYPEWVAVQSPTAVQERLARYGLAAQRNRHTEIWVTISRTLHSHYDSDPRMLLSSVDFDVARLLDLLREKKKNFPYLSGPKLSNYWPYILSHFTDVQLKNAYLISIIPDTHVIQSSVRLGLVPKTATPELVEAAWKTLLEGSGISPSEMHSALWHWSRNNFRPAV